MMENIEKTSDRVNDSEERFSRGQLVRRRLYAMRNGIVADALRQAGCPYRLIWGVNLPQLSEIAREFGPDAELARQLWQDDALREVALLAPMLFPVDELSAEEARDIVSKYVRWSEDADILCFKLLAHTPFAAELAATLAGASDDARLVRYTGLQLYLNIVQKNPQAAMAAAKSELERPESLQGLAYRLMQEAEFWIEEQ